jgi:hypothetical protein
MEIEKNLQSLKNLCFLHCGIQLFSFVLFISLEPKNKIIL